MSTSDNLSTAQQQPPDLIRGASISRNGLRQTASNRRKNRHRGRHHHHHCRPPVEGGLPYRDQWQGILPRKTVNELRFQCFKLFSGNGLELLQPADRPKRVFDSNRNIKGLLILSTLNVVCGRNRRHRRFSSMFFRKKIRIQFCHRQAFDCPDASVRARFVP